MSRVDHAQLNAGKDAPIDAQMNEDEEDNPDIAPGHSSQTRRKPSLATPSPAVAAAAVAAAVTQLPGHGGGGQERLKRGYLRKEAAGQDIADADGVLAEVDTLLREDKISQAAGKFHELIDHHEKKDDSVKVAIKQRMVTQLGRVGVLTQGGTSLQGFVGARGEVVRSLALAREILDMGLSIRRRDNDFFADFDMSDIFDARKDVEKLWLDKISPEERMVYEQVSALPFCTCPNVLFRPYEPKRTVLCVCRSRCSKSVGRGARPSSSTATSTNSSTSGLVRSHSTGSARTCTNAATMNSSAGWYALDRGAPASVATPTDSMLSHLGSVFAGARAG